MKTIKAQSATAGFQSRKVLDDAIKLINTDIVRHLETEVSRLTKVSKFTKKYKNRTGRLQKTHFGIVIPANKVVRIPFVAADESFVEEYISKPKKQIRVYMGARMTYGFYVEVVYNYDVIRQEFFKLKNIIKKIAR